MNLMPIIDTAAVLVSLFFLVLGSISDLKTREVDDKIWLFYGPLGVVLTTVRVVLEPSLLVLVGISFAIAFIISMGLFYFGLTGGADAKAIICLGLTLPLPPSSWHPLIGFVHPFFPLVVVIMSFISSGSMALWFCVRNTVSYARLKGGMFSGLEHESMTRKALAFASGYPTRIANLKSTFYLYPLEEVTPAGANRPSERHFKFFADIETDRDKLVSQFIDAAKPLGVNEMVWVTPGLPMLLFIVVGLIIALVFGDPIFGTILRSVVH